MIKQLLDEVYFDESILPEFKWQRPDYSYSPSTLLDIIYDMSDAFNSRKINQFYTYSVKSKFITNSKMLFEELHSINVLDFEHMVLCQLVHEDDSSPDYTNTPRMELIRIAFSDPSVYLKDQNVARLIILLSEKIK